MQPWLAAAVATAAVATAAVVLQQWLLQQWLATAVAILQPSNASAQARVSLLYTYIVKTTCLAFNLFNLLSEVLESF